MTSSMHSTLHITKLPDSNNCGSPTKASVPVQETKQKYLCQSNISNIGGLPLDGRVISLLTERYIQGVQVCIIVTYQTTVRI